MVDEPTKCDSQAAPARRPSSGGRIAVMGALAGAVYMLSILAAPVFADLPSEGQNEASVATRALWQAVSEGDPARQASAGAAVSAEDRRQRIERDQRLLKRVDAIGPRVLNPEDRFVRELLRYHLRRHIEELGVQHLALDTSEHAAELIALYQSLGFHVVARHRWSTVNYESVIMAKDLAESRSHDRP